MIIYPFGTAGHNGRLITSSVVSDRANFELYYPPFAKMIEAGVGSIMCSYASFILFSHLLFLFLSLLMVSPLY